MAETTLKQQAYKSNETPQITAKFRAYANAGQSNLSNGDKINFDVEDYDPGSNYDTTNSRFTAPVAGVYAVSVHTTFNGGSADKRYGWSIKLNGTTDVSQHLVHTSSLSAGYCGATDLLELAQGDYIEVFYNTHDSGDTADIGAAEKQTHFAAHLLST